MNKRTAILLTTIAMAVFSFILFALSYDKEEVATTAPTQQTQVAPIPVAQSTPISSISRAALQKYASADIETQTINGIEMSVSNFKIEGNLLEVNICFTNPDNQEWSLGEGAIQIGNDILLPRGGSTLEVSRNLGSELGEITIISDKTINVEKVNYSVPNYRCDTLSFVVSAEQMAYSGAVSLTVKNVHIVPKEGHLCAPVEAAQIIMDEKNLGIKIACTQANSNGLSGVEIKILEKPQGMSEEQAQQYIAEAQRQATFINGPWVFEGTVTGAGNP